MGRTVIGILGSARDNASVFAQQVTEESNFRAIAEVTDALPLMIPAMPSIDIGALLETVDGVMLTGAQSNIHPSRFGAEPHSKYEPYDQGRDAVSFPLIHACVEHGIPIFGICRGMQEMAVAFGGTLHPEISALPGKLDHGTARGPSGETHHDPNVVFAERHNVKIVSGGALHRIIGTNLIRVNSLHRQGVFNYSEPIILEGSADDGTVEAISIRTAYFAVGVQWHAEFLSQQNSANKLLLQAFVQAAKKRQA